MMSNPTNTDFDRESNDRYIRVEQMQQEHSLPTTDVA